MWVTSDYFCQCVVILKEYLAFQLVKTIQKNVEACLVKVVLVKPCGDTAFELLGKDAGFRAGYRVRQR